MEYEKINDNEAVKSVTTQVVVKLDEQLAALSDVQQSINYTTENLAKLQATKTDILATIAELEKIGIVPE